MLKLGLRNVKVKISCTVYSKCGHSLSSCREQTRQNIKFCISREVLQKKSSLHASGLKEGGGLHPFIYFV